MGTTTAFWRGCVTAIALAIVAGCGRSEGPLTETPTYSFDDVAAQLAAEEAASTAQREK
ncbi:MAG: hypothetical protein ACO1RT_15015 [Planctomycetaceae bacterium]